MRIGIIEDQPNIVTLIQSLLKEMGGCEVLFTSANIKNSIENILFYKPELLLMDIELEDGMSFEILKNIDRASVKVIFITSYQHFALKAIKYSAVDYLLKPINVVEFKEAIEKARTIQNITNEKIKVNYLLENIQSQKLTKIVIESLTKIYVLQIDDIMRCEVSNNFVVFYLVNGNSHIATMQLKELEQMLPNNIFVRTHHSHLVNINKVKMVDKKNLLIHLNNDTIVPISERKKKDVLKLLK